MCINSELKISLCLVELVTSWSKTVQLPTTIHPTQVRKDEIHMISVCEAELVNREHEGTFPGSRLPKSHAEKREKIRAKGVARRGEARQADSTLAVGRAFLPLSFPSCPIIKVITCQVVTSSSGSPAYSTSKSNSGQRSEHSDGAAKLSR